MLYFVDDLRFKEVACEVFGLAPTLFTYLNYLLG